MKKIIIKYNNIKVQRAIKKITQKQLGDKVDLSHTQIGNIENGKHDTTLPTAVKIANEFGMTVTELFELDKD